MTAGRGDDTGPTAALDEPVFPPILREVMLRPRWLAMLALCLVVAGVFAWLGQWQLARAVDTDPPPPGQTEVVRPLDDVVQPGRYLTQHLVGQRVSVSGTWVAGDFLLVSSRFNDGVEGYWVTGQLRVADAAAPTSIATAVGWAPTRQAAEAAAALLEAEVAARPDAVASLTGRVISDEGPALPPRGADPLEMTRMSPAALLARWHDAEDLDVYRPYLAAVAADAGLGAEVGLSAIASPAPEELAPVSWLNVFYAAEWVVFAGFAFYLWYRLARDAWEREVEAIEDAGGPASP